MKTLDVIFRMDRPRRYAGAAMPCEVTAVFPSLPGSRDPNTATCYARIGQHGACSRDWYRTTRAATPEEYAALHRELCNIYCGVRRDNDPPVRLRVVSRWTARHDRLRLEGLK